MKKLSTLISTLLLLFVLVAVPVTAQTSDGDVIDIDSETSTLEASEETETEATEKLAGVPETGIAPQDNPLLASTTVFAGGAALGTLIGLGIVQKRRKNEA